MQLTSLQGYASKELHLFRKSSDVFFITDGVSFTLTN